MGFLSGKRALVVGVANDRSIASGIAKSMADQGAELAFGYLHINDRARDRVAKVAEACGSDILIPCDVASDEDIDQLYQELGKHWDSFDIIVHAVAFANKDELQGDYLDNVTREGFKLAHDISSYSLAALAKAGKDMMREGGAIVTLSYLGADRAMPNYNVMGVAKASLEANVRYMAASLGPRGIRVNSISAGPIRTLAASGIGDFKMFLNYVENNAPLRRNVTTEDVGNTAAFLCSDLAGGITGENIYVDSGYNIIGMAE